MSRSDLENVSEILECIEAVDRAEASVQRHPGDPELAQVALDAVRYRVLTIGEAISALSADLREDHPAVAWSDLARMPDLIDHDAQRLDPQLVASTIGEPLRRLRSACRSILGESVRIGENEP